MKTIKTQDPSGREVLIYRVPGKRLYTTTMQSTQRDWEEGMPSFRLANGQPVNKVSDDEYTTMQGVTLRQAPQPSASCR